MKRSINIKRIVLILLAYLATLVVAQAQTDSVQNAYPLTYDAIRIRAQHLWVSLYDEQQAEIQSQCAAVIEFLDMGMQYRDTLQEVYTEAKTKAFNRYAEKYWQNCDGTDLDDWMACVNPNWVKVVAKMKKIIHRRINPTDVLITLEL